MLLTLIDIIYKCSKSKYEGGELNVIMINCQITNNNRTK